MPLMISSRTGRWNQHTQLIEPAQKGGIHLLFKQAVHFMLATFICWLLSAVCFIKGLAGYDRINVLEGTVYGNY